VPYVQSGVGRIYGLSPSAHESWGVTGFRVEDESFGFWCRGVAILFRPYASYFANRRGRCALIRAVRQSRFILNVTPHHSAMMEACLPHHDNVVVFRPLIRMVK
jgi:hypothetical protein